MSDATQPITTVIAQLPDIAALAEPAVGTAVREQVGSSDVRVFPLMLGGAEFGWNIDRAAGFAVLDRYRELGGNTIHTADRFGAGRSEHIIGQWVASRQARDETVLAVRVGGHPDNPGVGPTNLVRAVEASLSRIGTDYIDLLYLDAASFGIASLEDALATAEWLVDAGKARAIGAFGLTGVQLVEARILASTGYPRIDAIDVAYSLARRDEFEGDLRRVAEAQGIGVTPSHALEHGFLSGRHHHKRELAASTRGEQVSRRLNRKGMKLLGVLAAVAQELDLPPASVAVAWLLCQPSVVAPIVNADRPEHVDELVRGVGAAISRAQRADLSRASH